MSKKILDAWTRTTRVEETDNSTLTGLVHADRLLKLRKLVTSKPLIKEDLLVQQGAKVAKADRKLRADFESCKRNKSRHNKGNIKAVVAMSSDIAEAHTGFMVENAAKKAAAMDTLKAMRKELNQSLAKLQRDDENESSTSTRAVTDVSGFGVGTSSENAPSVLLRKSVLANVAVGSSASSKLNYIINEVSPYLW
jgi:hypothetical protein